MEVINRIDERRNLPVPPPSQCFASCLQPLPSLLYFSFGIAIRVELSLHSCLDKTCTGWASLLNCHSRLRECQQSRQSVMLACCLFACSIGSVLWHACQTRPDVVLQALQGGAQAWTIEQAVANSADLAELRRLHELTMGRALGGARRAPCLGTCFSGGCVAAVPGQLGTRNKKPCCGATDGLLLAWLACGSNAAATKVQYGQPPPNTGAVKQGGCACLSACC